MLENPLFESSLIEYSTLRSDKHGFSKSWKYPTKDFIYINKFFYAIKEIMAN